MKTNIKRNATFYTTVQMSFSDLISQSNDKIDELTFWEKTSAWKNLTSALNTTQKPLKQTKS